LPIFFGKNILKIITSVPGAKPLVAAKGRKKEMEKKWKREKRRILRIVLIHPNSADFLLL
jgi:hypothetical protein